MTSTVLMDAGEAIRRLRELEEFRPTAEGVNRLPEGLRRYVHDLETRADPAREVAERTLALDEVRNLAEACDRERARADAAEAEVERQRRRAEIAEAECADAWQRAVELSGGE